MDLNDIQVFVKVVDMKSLTVAADQLGMPKSTLSRRLSALEDYLGVQLVQRTTRHLSLTDVGMAYYVRCTEILASVAAANQLVTDLQDAPRGRLRLSVSPAFATRYFGALMASFTQRYPEITIELVVQGRPGNMMDEGFDLAIIALWGKQLDSRQVDARQVVIELAQPTLVFCAAPAYLSRRGVPQTPADLYAHDLILYMPEGVQSLSVSNGASTHEVAPPAHVLSDRSEPVRDALVAGAGLGCLCEMTIARELVAGQLVRVMPEWNAGSVRFCAVYPKRRQVPPRMAVFLDALNAWVADPPWSNELAAREIAPARDSSSGAGAARSTRTAMRCAPP